MSLSNNDQAENVPKFKKKDLQKLNDIGLQKIISSPVFI